MLIDISVGSRFWAFDLARELANRGHMRTLHTGYPSFSAERFGLDRSTLCSVWTHEPINRLLWQMRARGILRRNFDSALLRRYDRIVARRLRSGADLFIGWSGQCLFSLARAKELGMCTIVERGSTHIVSQRGILEQEQQKTGLPAEIPNVETVDQELAEYQLADYVAVPSAYVFRTFVAMGIAKEKLLLNPYGVNLSKFQLEFRSAPCAGSLRVIHVGRCSMRKGVHYLTQAVSEVDRAHVTFVGGIDRGILPIISCASSTVVGPVAGDMLPSHYANADVFCLLSLEEGLALVVAQAMACGLPVIVTPNTGGEELVTDGVEGFIVPIRSPEIVAERLRWLRDNPDQRIAMGRRARARVQAGFSWSDYGDRAVANYQRILYGRRVNVVANHG